MPLDHELEPVSRPCDGRPHAVAHEDVLQFGMQFEIMGICILSDSHNGDV